MTGDRKKALVYVFIFLLSLTGCESLPLRSGDISYGGKGILLDSINPQAKKDPGWFSKTTGATDKLKKQYQGESPAVKAVYLENDVFFYKDDRLATYIESIAERLLDGWEGPQPDIRVLIESSGFFNAYVDELGQLHVTTELLRRLDNEDQLASVIAHELGHILLRHNEKKSATNIGGRALEWGSIFASSFGEHMAREKGEVKYKKKGEDVAFRFESLGLIWSDLLAPKWSRSHEREADKIGLDLLMRANYNYEELPLVIEQIHDAAVHRSQRVSAFSKIADNLIGAKQRDAYQLTNTKWNKEIGDFLTGSVKKMKESAFKQIDRYGKSHDDREKRIDAIKTYLNNAYNGGDLPPEVSRSQFDRYVRAHTPNQRLKKDKVAIEILELLGNKRFRDAKEKSLSLRKGGGQQQLIVGFALSGVDAVNRRSKNAIRRLEKLSRSLDAPATLYLALAEDYLKSDNAPAAQRILLRGEKHVGRDFRFLPMHVRVSRNKKEVDVAEKYTLKCKKYDIRMNQTVDLILGAIGMKDSGSYYKVCSNELGYDVDKKRRKDKQVRNKKNKDNLDSLKDKLKGLVGK